MPQETHHQAPDLTSAEGTNIQIGIDQAGSEDLGQLLHAVLDNGEVQEQLTGVRYRILGSLTTGPSKDLSEAQTLRKSVLVYDYTNNRTLEIAASGSERAVVTPSSLQPPPSSDEWEEAVEIVRRDERFGRWIICGQLLPYRAMPALVLEPAATGESQRTLSVGLLPREQSSLPHQIVAVNMATQRVQLFESGHPGISLASGSTCGIPPVYCPAPARGTPGQLWIAWPASNPVWRFLAVRPAASSGISGSGLELRFVDYRGKSVLYQAHVPVLNVKYDGDACGPYRDWQWEEHCIQCNGTDVAPGFRWCGSAPQTACSGNDAGNFSGVAIHQTDCELVLTTEMEAGWYRYIQEWRFHIDGTIRPRFKFTAVSNSCVCNVHNHHVYWRFDFDLRTPGHNLVEEYNNPPLFPPNSWHKKVYEIKRLRDYGRRRKWRVRNADSGETYEIVPGPTDGVAGTFGKGDFWVLRYHSAEIDDGATGVGDTADIDKFVNGELVENQDVVVWYGAHFRHEVAEQGVRECHEVGPTLNLIRW